MNVKKVRQTVSLCYIQVRQLFSFALSRGWKNAFYGLSRCACFNRTGFASSKSWILYLYIGGRERNFLFIAKINFYHAWDLYSYRPVPHTKNKKKRKQNACASSFLLIIRSADAVYSVYFSVRWNPGWDTTKVCWAEEFAAFFNYFWKSKTFCANVSTDGPAIRCKNHRFMLRLLLSLCEEPLKQMLLCIFCLRS